MTKLERWDAANGNQYNKNVKIKKDPVMLHER